MPQAFSTHGAGLGLAFLPSQLLSILEGEKKGLQAGWGLKGDEGQGEKK